MCLYLWFTIGELRSPGNRVPLSGFAPDSLSCGFVGSRRVHVDVLMCICNCLVSDRKSI